MSKDIRIRRGIDLKIKGVAEKQVSQASRSKVYIIRPADFHQVTPKLLLKEGARVQAGEAIFFSKSDEAVKFVSPVNGTISEITRGEKRVILEIRIQADAQDQPKQHGAKDPQKLDAAQIKAHLLESGCWPFIKQRPYDVVANSNDVPKSIFVSTFASAPLAADFEFTLKDRLEAFQAGIFAISKLTNGKVHLGINGSVNSIFANIQGAEIHKVYGPHPAGNVGVQINQIDPINAGERVWVVGAEDVAIIGELLTKGFYNPVRTVAVVGPEVKTPQYKNVIIGAQMSDILTDNVASSNVRVISGDVLTGTKSSVNGSLGFYHTTVSVVKEGNEHRFFGWLPFASPHVHSMKRTSLSWLMPNKVYTPDTNLNGEERALVVTGEMEEVMPMDIYPMELLKACLSFDIEKMENLGIYEVAPEDFALVDYANTSKLEAQKIIREALDVMIKEVG